MARKYKLRRNDKVVYCDPFIEAEAIAQNSAKIVILDFSSFKHHSWPSPAAYD